MAAQQHTHTHNETALNASLATWWLCWITLGMKQQYSLVMTGVD